MSTNNVDCPVCGKVRAVSFNLPPTYSTWGLIPNTTTATISSVVSAGGYIPNTSVTIPWAFSHDAPEIVYAPSVSLMDICYGTGECASKACPVCTWMIRPGDDHDCAKLANSMGKSGTISHRDLEDKFIALLTQLRKDAELLAGDYTLSLDEDGQANLPWLAKVIAALNHATDEATSAIMD